jgi:5-carboxymethyl-2-hydroxymuconate isomerase
MEEPIMPHLTLETSDNLLPLRDPEGLFGHLHRLLESEAGIRIENCKSRLRESGPFLVGAGGKRKAFAHLDIRFLEGRPATVQERVGRAALHVLTAYFAEAGEELDLQITVEVQEIRRSAYFKHPPGTLSSPQERTA